MPEEELIYKFDAPKELQMHMERYEILVHTSNQVREKEDIAAPVALIGGLLAFSAIFFPSPELGTGIGTLGLGAAIFGGLWLYLNKKSKAQRFERMWEIESFFRNQGYAILQIPDRGVAIYQRAEK